MIRKTKLHLDLECLRKENLTCFPKWHDSRSKVEVQEPSLNLTNENDLSVHLTV